MIEPPRRRRRTIGQELAGPFARMWANGDGPTHASIDSALNVVGLDCDDYTGSKQAKVRQALVDLDNQTAVDLASEFVDLLRSEGIFETWRQGLYGQRVALLRGAFADIGAALDESGRIEWFPEDATPAQEGHALRSTEDAEPAPGAPKISHFADEVEVPQTSGPGLGLLVDVLRRLPAASRPLVVGRRKSRPTLQIADEYDVQDFVYAALRMLYDDTRAEEVVPSYAGGSSRVDFLIKAESTVVEVKVTRSGRGETKIRDEIIVDQRLYQAHPSAKHLVAVVYDLVGNFTNPVGFEDDLSVLSAGLRTTAVVVRWPPLA